MWLTHIVDGLSSIYRTEGLRGLYKGSLLALVGVSNGSIQFATYEEIKRRRTDIKRRLYEKHGRPWRVEDEKLVSPQLIVHSSRLVYLPLTEADSRPTPSISSRAVLPNSSPSPSRTRIKSSVHVYRTPQVPILLQAQG